MLQQLFAPLYHWPCQVGDKRTSAPLTTYWVHHRLLSLNTIIISNFQHFNRSLAIHIPVFLPMEQQEKNAICKDVLQAEIFKEMKIHYIEDVPAKKISDSVSTLRDSEKHIVLKDSTWQAVCPVTVNEIFLIVSKLNRIRHIPDITLECMYAEYRIFRKPLLRTILLTYAQRSKTFFVNGILSDDWTTTYLIALAELRATYVEYNQEELERYYLSLRLPIGE